MTLRYGFPKVGQVAPLEAMTYTQGATSSKGVRAGGTISKKATGGHDVIK